MSANAFKLSKKAIFVSFVRGQPQNFHLEKIPVNITEVKCWYL